MKLFLVIYALFCVVQSASCFFMSFRKEYDAACEEDGPLFGIWVYRAGVVIWLLFTVALLELARGQ
jgi:hypothetical protein